MFTLKQKINICLEYISTYDLNRLVELRKLAAEALAAVYMECSVTPFGLNLAACPILSSLRPVQGKFIVA